jgi:ADP-heptose:LPS heptosyltransferase
LQNNPFIDDIIVYDAFWFYGTGLASWFNFVRSIRQKQYDLIIEARADIRDIALLVSFCKARYKVSYGVGGGSYLLTHVVPYPGLTHKVDYHLNLASYLGCSLDNIGGGIFLQDTEKMAVAKLLANEGVSGTFIAVHPGSRLFLKRWPLERCASLCDTMIQRYGVPVVFVGAPAETEMVDSIEEMMTRKPLSLAGRLSLRELAAVLERAELFVCNDSAPMHIAAAVKTKTVAIFGPSKSHETGPYDVVCKVVERDMACRKSCDESRCRFEQYHACMTSITEADVLSSVHELMTHSK